MRQFSYNEGLLGALDNEGAITLNEIWRIYFEDWFWKMEGCNRNYFEKI